MREKLHRNIKAIYGLAFFNSFLVIVPVIVPSFMAKGLSLAEIFYLQAVFAASIVILEAPSGYFADIFGRCISLVIEGVIHGAAYFSLHFADDLATLVLFEVLAGVAASMFSGADLALLYDSQKALDDDRPSEHSKGIANLVFIRSSAEGLGALVGGALAMWSFNVMVVVQSVAAWICLLMAILLTEPWQFRSTTLPLFTLPG